MLTSEVVPLQDAEYMENKRSKRGGEDPAWMSQRQQNELDEADRFQVRPSAAVDLKACKMPSEEKLTADS